MNGGMASEEFEAWWAEWRQRNTEQAQQPATSFASSI